VCQPPTNHTHTRAYVTAVGAGREARESKKDASWRRSRGKRERAKKDASWAKMWMLFQKLSEKQLFTFSPFPFRHFCCFCFCCSLPAQTCIPTHTRTQMFCFILAIFGRKKTKVIKPTGMNGFRYLFALFII